MTGSCQYGQFCSMHGVYLQRRPQDRNVCIEWIQTNDPSVQGFRTHSTVIYDLTVVLGGKFLNDGV
jgi:hypothetical protein